MNKLVIFNAGQPTFRRFPSAERTWLNNMNYCARGGDLPAKTVSDGRREWYFHGRLYSIVDPNGWRRDDKRHYEKWWADAAKKGRK